MKPTLAKLLTIFCSTNEKNEEVCKTKFNRGYLVVNFYPNKKASPQKVSFVDLGNFNESQFYNINDKNIRKKLEGIFYE